MRIPYLLVTKEQLDWYADTLTKSKIRYYLKDLDNYLYRGHPLTTNRFIMNSIDLRDEGNDLGRWSEKVQSPEYISLSLKE